MSNIIKNIVLVLGMTIAFTSCKGDVNTDLKGQTFKYYNQAQVIRERFSFENNGNVYHYSSVLGISYDTKGCALYYTLEDKTLTIYYGTRGWKKEVRNTVYRKGQYFGDYLVIDDKRFERD